MPIGPLRSQSQVSSEDIKMDVSSIDNLLNPIKNNIQEINAALENINSFLKEKLQQQGKMICNLKTRIEKLEARVSFNEHISKMNERKLDDTEQISRKINLRLSGIEVSENDTPEHIMKGIKEEVKELDLGIEDFEYDRCHRIGKKYFKRGKVYQDVLLKLCFWKTRNTMYQNRKRFNFKINPDLTGRRSDILQFAHEKFDNDEIVKRNVNFVFCDLNCKLKFCSKENLFCTFNSKWEFLAIVSGLDRDRFASEKHIEDEKYPLVNNYY